MRVCVAGVDSANYSVGAGSVVAGDSVWTERLSNYAHGVSGCMSVTIHCPLLRGRLLSLVHL